MERDRRRRRCRSPPSNDGPLLLAGNSALSCFRPFVSSSAATNFIVFRKNLRSEGRCEKRRLARWGSASPSLQSVKKIDVFSFSTLSFLVLTANRIKGENNGRPVRQTQRARGGRPEDDGRGVSSGDTRGRCRNAAKLGNAARLGYGPAHRGYGDAGDRRSGPVILGTGALAGRLLAPARRVLCAAGARTWAA